MTNVFLGYPPEHIRQWIIEHSSNEPAEHEKTWIWFEGQDNYEEFDWSGIIDRQTMIDAELFEEADESWTRNLVKVEIGTKVTTIGYSVFEYCIHLTSVTIPNSVTIIKEGAFIDCSSLTSITIPDSVKSIGGGEFSYCIGLTSITIDGVTSIGGGAFANCSSLTTANFPCFTQAEIVANAYNWYLGYKCNDDGSTMITFPVTVTAKDGTFILHQS